MSLISEAEATKEGCEGPIIRWDNYGYEGWKPRSFATVKDAVTDEQYGNEYVVTRAVQFDVTEQGPRP